MSVHDEAADRDVAAAAPEPSLQIRQDVAKPAEASREGKKTCNTCKVSFEDSSEHREHFRCDWHRHNLRLKSEGKPTVALAEFEILASMKSNTKDDLFG